MPENRGSGDSHTATYHPEILRAPVADNSALVDSALAAHRQNFLLRLFPNDQERAVRGHELDQIKAGFEFRRRALQMAVETKLQAMEEMCNHVLVTGKSEIRRQRQEFFAEQQLKLQTAMDQHAERFNTRLERRLAELQRYQNPQLRQREEQRLLRALDQFHEMIEQLSQDFMAIIHEGVHR